MTVIDNGSGKNIICESPSCLCSSQKVADLIKTVNGNGHTFNGNGPFYWVSYHGVFWNTGVKKAFSRMGKEEMEA